MGTGIPDHSYSSSNVCVCVCVCVRVRQVRNACVSVQACVKGSKFVVCGVYCVYTLPVCVCVCVCVVCVQLPDTWFPHYYQLCGRTTVDIKPVLSPHSD